MNLRKQTGFTLIELIVVIVILGILAATALPRFINLGGDARFAAANGIAGGLRSAVSLAQGRYLATGNMAATTIATADGTVVTVNAGTGIPVGTAAGIGNAMASLEGMPAPDYTDPLAVIFRPTGGTAACQVLYNGTTGVVTVTAANAAAC